MNRIMIASTCLALLTLAACGNNTGDRAVSGGLIGAGVGAVGGALVGSPGAGALIGGAVGAGTGALTNNSQINAGRPVWR
jgi:osmotically inducible lipoprotein OsmB